VSLGYVRSDYVGNTVGKISYVSDFVLHTTYTVDACALVVETPDDG
jgi:hypothetical protein